MVTVEERSGKSDWRDNQVVTLVVGLVYVF